MRDAGDLHAVVLSRVDGEAAPAAADVQHSHRPASDPSLRGDQIEFCPLSILERLRAPREDRAAVGHRLVEEEREELVADVVVVADRAASRSMLWRSPPGRARGSDAGESRPAPPRRQRGEHQADAVDRPASAAAPSRRPPRTRRRGRRRPVALDVGATQAQLAGSAQEVGERGRPPDEERRGVTAVARTAPPSQKLT